MKTLHIVIDASPISIDRGRGYRRHVLGLIKALAENKQAFRYFILSSDCQIKNILPKNDSRFQWEHPRRRIPMFYRRGVGILGRLFLKDIDFAHFPCGDIWSSPRGKAIVTIHDLAPLHFPKYFFTNLKEETAYRQKLARIARYASMILTVSDYSREDVLRHLNVSDQKVRTVYNYLDPVFIKQKETMNRQHIQVASSEAPYFLFVGALDFRKNIPLLLEAFKELELIHTIRPHQVSTQDYHQLYKII